MRRNPDWVQGTHVNSGFENDLHSHQAPMSDSRIFRHGSFKHIFSLSGNLWMQSSRACIELLTWLDVLSTATRKDVLEDLNYSFLSRGH